MQQAGGNFPQRWMDYMNQPRNVVEVTRIGSKQRAFYSGTYRTVFTYNGNVTVATHELMHHAENTVPGIRDAEWYMKWTRETEPSIVEGARRVWEPLKPYSPLTKGEFVREDNWPTNYMGKDYSNNNLGVATPNAQTYYELLSTTSEAFVTDPGSTLWQDYMADTLDQIGLRSWFMAMMATIG